MKKVKVVELEAESGWNVSLSRDINTVIKEYNRFGWSVRDIKINETMNKAMVIFEIEIEDKRKFKVEGDRIVEVKKDE